MSAITSTECSICLISFKEGNSNLHTTECGHSFHHRCFKKIKASTCPCCRAPVLKDYTVRLAEKTVVYRKAKSNYDIVSGNITKEFDVYEKEIDKMDKDIIKKTTEYNTMYKLYMNSYYSHYDDEIDKLSEELKVLNTKRKQEIRNLNDYGREAQAKLRKYSDTLNITWSNVVYVRITRFGVV